MASHDQVPEADRPGDERPRVGEEARADVRARRERLRSELMNLEQTLTGPSADTEAWTTQVRGAALAMRETLQDHVEETEAPDGMLAQVARDAPWLEGRLEQLRSEHERLTAAADALVARCEDAEPQEIRDEAMRLLGQVSRHRQLGTDLLYDAYLVDISAAD